MMNNIYYKMGFEKGFILGRYTEANNGGFGNSDIGNGDVKMANGGLYMISDILNPQYSMKFAGVDIFSQQLEIFIETVASAFTNLGFETHISYEDFMAGPNAGKSGKITIFPANGWKIEVYTHGFLSGDQYIVQYATSDTMTEYYFNETLLEGHQCISAITGGYRFYLYTSSDLFLELTGIRILSVGHNDTTRWIHKVGDKFVRFGNTLYDSIGALYGVYGAINNRLTCTTKFGTDTDLNYHAMALINPILLSENERKYSDLYPILLDGVECSDFIISNYRISTDKRYFYCAKEAGSENGILFYSLGFVGNQFAYILIDLGSQYAEYVNSCMEDFIDS